jgi:hypothetical protein
MGRDLHSEVKDTVKCKFYSNFATAFFPPVHLYGVIYAEHSAVLEELGQGYKTTSKLYQYLEFLKFVQH